MFKTGTKVRLRRWAANQEFFDTDGYMWNLARKDRIFEVYDEVSPKVYNLRATLEEPKLGQYVWRDIDLIPVGATGDPNYAFMLRRMTKLGEKL